MPIISWSSAIAINDVDVDTQHKKLFGLINDLHDAMSQGKGKEILGKVLDGLIDYTKTHFSYEQNRMQKENYVGYVAHKAEHDKFTAKVVDLQDQYKTGKYSMTIEVSTFMKDWLVSHIQVNDRKAFGK